MNPKSLKRPTNNGKVAEEEAGDGGLTHIRSRAPSRILLGPNRHITYTTSAIDVPHTSEVDQAKSPGALFCMWGYGHLTASCPLNGKQYPFGQPVVSSAEVIGIISESNVLSMCVQSVDNGTAESCVPLQCVIIVKAWLMFGIPLK